MASSRSSRLEPGVAPRLDPLNSPRVPSSPLSSKRHHAPSGTSPTALWSSVFPSTGRKSPKPPHLPTFGTRRPFATPESRFSSVKKIILRPLYILGRRGPFLPILAAIFVILFFFVYSTSSSGQSVKRRVKGAVGPYIPQRASEAVNWKGGKSWRERKARNKWNLENKTVLEHVPLKAKRSDGRMLIEEGKRHPIPELMRRAKQRWLDLKGKQSKTFEAAVAEYKRRYGINPPKGFDQWYAFAKNREAYLIDEFDLINKDLHMYRAFKPSVFRSRIEFMAEPTTFDQTWTMEIKNGKAIRGGLFGDHDRAKGVVDLMDKFIHLLPDMKIVHNNQDGARVPVVAEERIRLSDLVKKGEFDNDIAPPFKAVEKGAFPHWGMSTFCPPGSAVRETDFEYGFASADVTGLEMPPLPPKSIGTIIDDFSAYLDVCNNPQYRHFHATTSWVYAQQPGPVIPLFTPGVQTTFGDIHCLITEQLDLEQEHNPSWEDRPFDSLQWRGQTSGPLWDIHGPWKTTHRARLHLLSHQEEGTRKVIITDERDNAKVVEVANERLNHLFLDVGMVGPAVQCIKEDGTCAKMYEVFGGYDKRISFDRAALYKYVLDVDGNSWSGRFRRLMMSNAAVVKTTIFPEFWTDWAIPWLHYIPMQVDYSDMWDIMAFFRGGVDGEGAHDDLGKEIALAGKEWVRNCYRWEDLEVYQYRLMLEYGRLYTDETSPGSNDFVGDVTIEPLWIEV